MTTIQTSLLVAFIALFAHAIPSTQDPAKAQSPDRLDPASKNFDGDAYMAMVDVKWGKRAVLPIEKELLFWRGYQSMTLRQFAAQLKTHEVLAGVALSADVSLSEDPRHIDFNYHRVLHVVTIAYSQAAEGLGDASLDKEDRARCREALALMDRDEYFDRARAAWRADGGASARRALMPFYTESAKTKR
jgi:hypothetical protein